MIYQLKIDEIMEGLNNSAHPEAATFQGELEALANRMAKALAGHIGVRAGVGDFQGLGFAGTCVPFYPVHPGQPLPDAIDGFDNEEEWDGDTQEIPLDTPSLDTSFHDHEMDVGDA